MMSYEEPHDDENVTLPNPFATGDAKMDAATTMLATQVAEMWAAAQKSQGPIQRKLIKMIHTLLAKLKLFISKEQMEKARSQPKMALPARFEGHDEFGEDEILILTMLLTKHTKEPATTPTSEVSITLAEPKSDAKADEDDDELSQERRRLMFGEHDAALHIGERKKTTQDVIGEISLEDLGLAHHFHDDSDDWDSETEEHTAHIYAKMHAIDWEP